jgi:hypothetical protein
MAKSVDTPIGTVTPEHFRPDQLRNQVIVGPTSLYTLFNAQDQMYGVSRAFITFVRDGNRITS